MHSKSEKRFIITNLISIIMLFVLILAGGVVRSTGSGMGCPDWPKCFDQYVPPTSAAQLPADYQQKFVDGRVAKNERFAHTLDVLGHGDLADRIREDKSILQPEEFNAAKTWTEYINRLIGALSGFFLLGCMIFSVAYWKSRKRIFSLSLFNLFLVGFQAWMGSIVVSTNLLAWVVTVHMLLALAIVAICIYTYFEARNLNVPATAKPGWLIRLATVAALLLSIVQITLGTEVREQLDAIADAMNNLNRADWVNQVGVTFNFHRELAILVLTGNFLLFRWISKAYAANSAAYKFMTYSLNLIGLQLVSGIVLSHLALPPAAQTIHILVACLLFGTQFYLLLSLKYNSKGGSAHA